MRASQSVLASVSALFLFAGACAHAPAASPPAAASPSAEGPVAARVGAGSITLAEVDKAAGKDLFDLREQALDKLIAARVLKDAAERAGQPPEAFLEHQLASRVPAVTEATAREFFEKNHDRMGAEVADKSFDEVKAQLIPALTQRARREAAARFLDDLKDKAGVKILLETPRVQVAATGPAKGPADARITIIEFSDFQCPYCARGKQVMDEVVAAYGQKVRLVFRDYPLPFHDNAEKAAEAGHCAADQGKFWELHDWMFDNQQSLSVDEIKKAAKDLGLDEKRFNACVDTGQYTAAVGENQRAGEEVGVHGTPAFFVNGISISGAQPFEKFKGAIDRELAR